MLVPKLIVGSIGVTLLLGAILWHRQAKDPAVDVNPPGSGPSIHAGNLPGSGARHLSWLAQPGTPSRTISGVVLFEGVPTSATVTLSSTENLFGIPEPSLTTAGDGRFEFPALPATAYIVTATASGYGPTSTRLALNDPKELTNAVQLALTQCRHRVSGVVRSSSGAVIPGARVRTGAKQPLGPAVTSGEEGAFELCADPDRSGFQVAADGHGALAVDLEIEEHVRYDVWLVPEAVIAGRVQRLDGTPLTGAAVALDAIGGSGESPVSAYTLAGPDGRYELRGVSPGSFELTASGDGWVPAETTRVEVGVGSHRELRLAVRPSASLRGRAFTEGAAVAGVWLGWKPRNYPLPTVGAWTQADGTFHLTGIRPGTGELTSGAHAIETPRKLTLTPESSGDLEVRLWPGPAICGRITHQGRPAAGAKVIASKGGGSFSTIVGADGRFKLSMPASGRHTVGAWGWRQGARASQRSVDVTTSRCDEIELILEDQGRIEGRVVDAHGVPVAGATVTASLDGDSSARSAHTRDDGTYSIGMLSEAGRYQLQVEAPGSVTPLRPAKKFPTIELEDPTQVVTGAELVVRFKLGSISGILIDTAGKPVAHARVTAESTRPDGAIFYSARVDRAVTNAEGHFELTLYGPATYLISVLQGELRARAEHVALGSRDVRLVLAPRD